jgi:hypothetical protein
MADFFTPRTTKGSRKTARGSTGPRTAAGKRRSSRNAIKHGLAVPIGATPGMSDRIAKFAPQVAGEAVEQVSRQGSAKRSSGSRLPTEAREPASANDPELLQAAKDFVAAQLDLLRIREVRSEYLKALIVDPPEIPETERLKNLNQVSRLATTQEELARIGRENSKPVTLPDLVQPAEEAYAQQAFVNALAKLKGLERYERRALSRRKRAARALDAMAKRSPSQEVTKDQRR